MLPISISLLLLCPTAYSAVDALPPQPKAEGLRPAAVPARPAPGQRFVEQGNKYYFEGKPEQALQSYERALQTGGAGNTSALDARLNGAVILEDLGRSAKAADWLKKALELSPRDPRALTALGSAELGARDFDSARTHFRAALEFAPKDAFALTGLGRTELRLGRFEDAAAHFKSATRYAPNFDAAYYWKAQAAEANQDVGGAIAAYQRAAANDFYFVEARYALARLYMRYQMLGEASAQITRVLDADPASKTLRSLKLQLQGFVGRGFGEGGIARRLFKRDRITFMPQRDRIPLLRVGIGTNPMGKPNPRYALEFACATRFAVKDAKTGAVLAEGSQNRRWHIHFVARKPVSFEIFDPDYHKVASSQNALRIRPQVERGGTIMVYDLPQVHPHPWRGPAPAKTLRGELELSPNPDRRSFRLVDIVDLESYTHGLLSAEMPIGSPLEALKAQSVVARTNALYLKTVLHRHRKDGYDLCDGEHCQVYNGVAAESERSRVVVDATRGRIVAFHGKPAQVLYSANCGGHTQSGAGIEGWGTVPYWKGIPDLPPDSPAYPRSPWGLYWWLRETPAAYCMASANVFASHYRWTRIVPATALEEKLDRNLHIGRLLGLRPLRRSESGHLNSILVLGTRRNVRLIHETHIRNFLGVASQRSTLFSLETERGPDGRPTAFIFYGGGWGHGVGMCQSGAMGRAERDQTYVDILKAYFPGTELGDLRY